MSFELTAVGLAWVAIVVLALVVSGLIRQVHILSSGQQVRKLQLGPRPGSEAPSFARYDLPRGRPAVVFFAERGCSSCAALLPSFGQLARGQRQSASFVIAVSEDERFDTRTGESVTQITGQGEAFERFGVSVTPFGVAISASGTVVAASPITSPDDFARLLDDAAQAVPEALQAARPA